MHDDAAHRWTLQELAECVGTSRSIFALRFKETVGSTPMDRHPWIDTHGVPDTLADVAGRGQAEEIPTTIPFLQSAYRWVTNPKAPFASAAKCRFTVGRDRDSPDCWIQAATWIGCTRVRSCDPCRGNSHIRTKTAVKTLAESARRVSR